MYLPFLSVTLPASRNLSFVTCTMYWLSLLLASSALSMSPAYTAIRSPCVAFSRMNSPIPAPGIVDSLTTVFSAYADCFLCSFVDVHLLRSSFTSVCSGSCGVTASSVSVALSDCGSVATFVSSILLATVPFPLGCAVWTPFLASLCIARSSLRARSSSRVVSACAADAAASSIAVSLFRALVDVSFASLAFLFACLSTCSFVACFSVRPCTLCLAFFPVATSPVSLCRFTFSS